MGAPGDSAPHGGQLQAPRTCQERDLLEAAGGSGLGTLERSVKAGGAGQTGAWWGAGWEKDRESGGTEEGLGAGLGRGRGRPRLKAAGRAGGERRASERASNREPESRARAGRAR